MKNLPWEIELIPVDSKVYRLIPLHMIRKGSRIPSESMFQPDADGLSVDWDKYSTPAMSLVRTGLTFRFNSQEYKDPSRFLVFRLNVGEAGNLEEVIAVNHTPVFHGDPAPVGLPNNRSHSSILGEDEEIRLKLRDIAFEELVEMEQVLEEVNKARKTPAHQDL